MIDRYDDFEIEKTPEEELDSLDYFDEDDEMVSTHSYPTCYNDYGLGSDD